MRSKDAIIEQIKALDKQIMRHGSEPKNLLDKRDNLFAELDRDHGIASKYRANA